MRDWCAIVPFHRPELSGHVAAYLERQTCRPRWLVVVGNGAGRDGLRADDLARIAVLGIEPVAARCPIAHPAHARNRGLDVALELGAEWIMCVDSDDHYGPGCLASLDAAAGPKRLVGKRPHRVIDDLGAFECQHPSPVGRSQWVGGALQAYPAELARKLRYPDIAAGEDVLFCMLAERLGFEVWDTGPADFVYERRGAGHAWQKNARRFMGFFTPIVPIDLSGTDWVLDPPARADTKEIAP